MEAETRQAKLFATGLNEQDAPIVPTESQRAAQKREILQALRWAGELGVTALRMREICPSSLTQRISDLRKEGHNIVCRSESGYNVYHLSTEAQKC